MCLFQTLDFYCFSVFDGLGGNVKMKQWFLNKKRKKNQQTHTHTKNDP